MFAQLAAPNTLQKILHKNSTVILQNNIESMSTATITSADLLPHRSMSEAFLLLLKNYI